MRRGVHSTKSYTLRITITITNPNTVAHTNTFADSDTAAATNRKHRSLPRSRGKDHRRGYYQPESL